MARTKKTENGRAVDSTTSDASDSRPATRLVNVVIPAEERDVVKVNNANLVDLKNACDDILKRVRDFVILPLRRYKPTRG